MLMITIRAPAVATCAMRKHRSLFITCFVALIAVALPLNARASLILATIRDTIGLSFPDNSLNGSNHQQQTVTLSYNNPASPPLCVGCELASTGFTGTTDFTAANTPDFNDFTSHLTNGVDEVLLTENLYYTSGGVLFVGAGVGRLESDQFGLPSDLQGDTIDFIRRQIFTNTLTPQPGNRFESDVDVSWEIWGTGPVVSPVAEPASLTLLCVGVALGGIGMVRRRTRQTA